ncbi:MAG: hypothetical protein HYV07_15350 [Deltaproteobacteria bacterium]|nr:hypothetical protein [Deltaproteobacteria bacterium]
MNERRARAFAELRRRNNVADAARTPAERLADAEVLLRIALAAGVDQEPRGRTDEPQETWRRLRERSRR